MPHSPGVVEHGKGNCSTFVEAHGLRFEVAGRAWGHAEVMIAIATTDQSCAVPVLGNLLSRCRNEVRRQTPAGIARDIRR